MFEGVEGQNVSFLDVCSGDDEGVSQFLDLLVDDWQNIEPERQPLHLHQIFISSNSHH